MFNILMSNGMKTFVDSDIVDRLKHTSVWAHKKYKSTEYYAAISLPVYVPNGRTKYKTVLLHRFVLEAKSSQKVDHINGNPLDNRRENLRFATSNENQHNRKKSTKKTSSRFKGVTYLKNRKKWKAAICLNRHHIHLGCFETEEQAAKAYNEAAVKHFGTYACLNVL